MDFRGEMLCESCRQVDLRWLLTGQTITLQDFAVAKSGQKPLCPLCGLISQCADLSGRGHDLRTKARSIRLQSRNLSSDSSGRVHVSFFETKKYPKGDRRQGSRFSNPIKPIGELLGFRHRWLSRGGVLSKEHGIRSVDDVVSSPTALFPGVSEGEDRESVAVESPLASWIIHVLGGAGASRAQQRTPVNPSIPLPLLTSWLEECDNGHHHAYMSEDQTASRIKVIIRMGRLRVINTTTGQISTLSTDEPFVALSYVWGSIVEQHQSLVSLPILSYSPTIRDAANIAKSIGFSWLWVDRICIDQTNAAEIMELIPYIKDIFAAAELTIVAASGKGAHSGLPGSADTLRPAEKVTSVKLKAGKQPMHMLPDPQSFNTQYDDCLWRTRGWTLEEQVFSRRLLYVFDTEMFFCCSKGFYRESMTSTFTPEPAGSTWGDSGSRPPIVAAELYAKFHNMPPLAADSISITIREFVRVVEEYSTRHLTVEEDRVGAFAGLITAATSQADDIPWQAIMKHGHPLQYFGTLLTWQRMPGFIRHSKYGAKFAPSWSWPSAQGRIRVLDNGDDYYACNLFHFVLVKDSDILGLPFDRHSMMKAIGVKSPTHIISQTPWLHSSPPMGDTNAQSDTSALPTLHLVTILFEAMIMQIEDGQHAVWSVDRPVWDWTVKGDWSISPSDHIPAAPSRRRFALVGANDHQQAYIMLLDKVEAGPDLFTRAGLTKVSDLSFNHFLEIISTGGADWTYIRLI